MKIILFKHWRRKATPISRTRRSRPLHRTVEALEQRAMLSATSTGTYSQYDVNHDGYLNLGDVIALVSYYNDHGAGPVAAAGDSTSGNQLAASSTAKSIVISAADVNGDGYVNLADVIKEVTGFNTFGSMYTGVLEPPKANVTGNNAPIVDGATSISVTNATDFGATAVNGAGVSRTFTITNTGATPLNITNVAISGISASEFTITDQPANPIAPAGTATVTVKFLPAALGTRAASVAITDDDPSQPNPYTFAIGGTGAPLVVTADTILQFNTSLGSFQVELFDSTAPQTVANFLSYVDSGAYNNVFFHRFIAGFVAQTGGYSTVGAPFPFSTPPLHIPQGNPVQNEFHDSNLAGTLAMAKVSGNPNSATSEFFFNLGDNSSNLDSQNGGYTVFGKVLGNGMDIINAISAVPIYDASSVWGNAFTSLPLQNYAGGDQLLASNFIVINSITHVTSGLSILAPADTQAVAINGALPVTGVSLADPSLPAADSITLNLAVSHGTLSLLTNVSGGVTNAQVVGNGTGSVTITAPLAALDATLAALNGLTYLPASGFDGVDILALSASDTLGNNELTQVAIAVVGPFSITTPAGTQSVGVNGTLPVTSVSVTDPSLPAAVNVTLQLGAAHGLVSLSTAVAGGVTPAQVSGNGTSSVTITAPLAAINATLSAANGLLYTPLAGFNGADALSLSVSDSLGNVLNSNVPINVFIATADTILQFNTSLGSFQVELFDSTAPQTVANFLSYVDSGAYNNVFFHRFIAGFVAQSGGYSTAGAPITVSTPPPHIAEGTPIPNEFHDSNLAGTLAMAKVSGNPNSATSEFFFNLGDNSSNLDSQNGGYTVFGKVLGNGMDIINAISAVPIYDASSVWGNAFTSLPLQNYAGGDQLLASNFIVINSITHVTFGSLSIAVPVGTQTVAIDGTLDVNGVSLADPGLPVADNVSLTLSAAHGTMTLSTAVSGGVTAGQITGNNTGSVTVTAPLAAINTTLAAAGGLLYMPSAGFSGADTLFLSASDTLGNTGFNSVAIAVVPRFSVIAVTNPINLANTNHVTVIGTGEFGASLQVIASDGTHATTPSVIPVALDGTWLTVLDVSGLDDGTITFTAIASNSPGFSILTATKDTMAPAVAITGATNPVTSANVHDVSVSGMGEAGAVISLVATDGTNSTAAHTATVDASGQWTIAGIDLTALADGAITILGTATDSVGNTATVTQVVTKSIAGTLAITTPPGTQLVTVNGALAVNGVSIADSSVPATDNVTMFLSVSHGTLSLLTNVAGGVTSSQVTGNGTGSVTVTATVAALNATLADLGGLVYTPASGFSGPLSLSLSASDTLGNTDFANVDIAVVGPISITTLFGAQSVAVNSPVSVFGVSLTDPSLPAASNVTLSLNASHGTIILSTAVSGGVTGAQITSNGTGSVTVTAPLAAINATLAAFNGLLYTPVNGFNGVEILALSGTDLLGNTGFNSVAIAVVGPISITVPSGTQSVAINGTLPVNGVSLADPALPAASNVMLSLSAAHGTIVLSTAVSGGVTGAQVQGNGTDIVTVTAPLAAINATLAAFNGLLYTPVNGFHGADSLALSASDAVANFSFANVAIAVGPTFAMTAVTNPINLANANHVTVSGSGEFGSSIQVVASDGTHSTTPAAVAVALDGTWSMQINVSGLDDGTITFTAIASNSSGVSTLTATKDTVAPVVAITAATDPITPANVNQVVVSGTGEAGAVISLVASDGTHTTIFYTATVNDFGLWSIVNVDASGLNDGTVAFTAIATDAVGNTTTVTRTSTKGVMGTSLAITSVTNPISLANYTATTAQGTGEVGAAIELVASDGTHTTAQFTTTVNNAGIWAIGGIDLTALNDGTIIFLATSKDLAGHTVIVSRTATKDTVVPALVVNSVSNPITLANYQAATATGTGEIGANITLRAGDVGQFTGVYTTVVNGSGNWAISGIDLAALNDGTITYYVTANDAVGNTTSITRTATKDTVAPELAIVTVTNPINATNYQAAAVSGTGTIGTNVLLVVSDGTHVTTQFSTIVNNAGNWAVSGINLTTLADGTITFVATTTDGVGNTTIKSKTAIKDIIAPALSITAVADPINLANHQAATAAGTGEIGAGIVVVVNDGTHFTHQYATIVNGAGTWAINGIDLTSLTDGTIIFATTASDAAGNATVSTRTATKDTVAPTVLGISLLDAPITNAAAVHFLVSFNELIDGISPGNFGIVATGINGASIASVVPSGPHMVTVGGKVISDQYLVTVNSGTGSGTLALALLNGGTVVDQAGNLLTGLPITSLPYKVRLVPAVISINDFLASTPR